MGAGCHRYPCGATAAGSDGSFCAGGRGGAIHGEEIRVLRYTLIAWQYRLSHLQSRLLRTALRPMNALIK
jgi:hypothetical protein